MWAVLAVTQYLGEVAIRDNRTSRKTKLNLGFSLLLTRNDITLLVLVTMALTAGIFFASGSISAIGLTLDIAGVLMLWRFGLPSHLKPGGKVVNTEWDVEIDLVEKKRFAFAKWLSEIAVFLMTMGFVLQFIGSVKSA